MGQVDADLPISDLYFLSHSQDGIVELHDGRLKLSLRHVAKRRQRLLTKKGNEQGKCLIISLWVTSTVLF